MIKFEKWESFPNFMQDDIIKEYYNILCKKWFSIVLKRAFDIILSIFMLVLFSPIIALIAILIKIDSPGKVIFKQERITRFGKKFYIYKFRTMIENAESFGSLVTVANDQRVTRIGKVLRKYRIDEFLQLINILKGEMSFVGTRPEVKKYVEAYTNEMNATLLMPAGVTSLASIYYKNEEVLISEAENADETYINEVLPQKMKYNLEYIKRFSIWYDIKLIVMTVLAVCGKNYTDNSMINHQSEKAETNT